MNFCSQCGHSVEVRIPAGDNRPRYICVQCEMIHYQNPKIVAGTIPVWGDQILLCRRAIEPRLGFWTLPAGFMENAETTSEAAIRETWEEAEARVTLEGLFSMISIPHIDQVHIFFRASLMDNAYGPGPESLEVKLFREDEIPWSELAFPTVKQTLELYFADSHKPHHGVHVKEIRRQLPPANTPLDAR